MKFVYPAGLLALLGILVLLAVTLMRRKYDVTTLASTYLWRLSERFRKQNQTVQRLKRALLFALQLVGIVLAALMIAQPLVLLPGAGTHVVAILDGSSSMRTADAGGQTRFDRALLAVEADVAKLPLGSSVSVILSGDEAAVLCEGVSKNDVRGALERAQCGFGAGDLDGASALAQAMFDENGASQAVLYTDQDVQASGPVRTVNLSAQGEWNVTVRDLRAESSIYGTAFTAEVVSVGQAATVDFELTVDGKQIEGERLEVRVDERAQEGASALCPAGERVQVTLLARQVYDYASARVVALAEDGLAQDNELRLYVPEKKTVRALLVGEKAYFLKQALSAFPRIDLATQDTARGATFEGYDLYVFDGCLPETMPADGAIWIINPPYTPKGTGVAFGEELLGARITARRDAQDGTLLQLTRGLSLKEAAVVRLREVVSAGRMTPALLCGAYPVLLYGRTDGGYAQLLMPMDLQNTNLPLLADYVVLIGNMLDFSVPAMLPAQRFDCGQAVFPRTMPDCEKLFLQTPDMSIRTLANDEREAGVRLSVPGGYTLLAQEAGGEERIFSFFARMPLEETQDGEAATIALTPGEGGAAQAKSGQHVNLLRALAAALLLLLSVEWVVYQREKY